MFFVGGSFGTMFHSVSDKALSLSIIIPAYNEQSHLPACLDSIARQTSPPDEVLVIDNNSTDRTADIARGYSFVRLVYEQQQGIVFARNAGFDRATGHIIARIDADTQLPDDWVAHIRAFYANGQHQQHAITGGGYFYNLRMPRFNGWLQSQLAFRMNRWVAGHYILWGSNMAFLRPQWQAVREQVCLRDDVHEDLDLAIHLHSAGYQITYHAKDIRVGVYMKRFWSDRHKMRAHMQRWPQSFRAHHYNKWWMGVVGNVFLWGIVGPLILATEGIARLLGKQSITRG